MAKVSWIRVLLWLLPRRVRASWLLLGISSFGILAAVILMAIGAIYSRALAEGGLRHTLATTSTALLDGQVIVQKRPLGLADYQNLQGIVEEFIDARLGHTLLDKQRFGRTQPNLTLVLGRGQERSPEFDPIGQPFFLTQFENHTRIVGGHWPQTVPPRGDGQLRLEVVVGDRTAAFLGWRVGSESSLIPFRSNPSERITLTVVGLAEPADPDDRYWMGASSIHFDLQEFGENILVPIYVREADFFGGMGARYPSLLSDYGWSIYVDASALNVATVKPTKEAVVGLETDINKQFPRSLVLTGLGTILSGYEKDLKHARVPLFVFMSLVVLVILYFLALVAGLLARIQGAEASLLRSRGASRFQVVQLLVLVEGGIALLAMVVGPFLALLIVRHLLLGTINPAGGGEALSAGLSADMFVLGAIGGALSLGALVFSGVGLARVGMVEFLRVRARPPTVPLLQRYYVDVLVLAAVGILWWQIQGRGGFVERDILGEALEVDSSLLLGPVLVILAAAFLLLRILPLLARAMAWVGVRLAPAWVSFALARIARDPLPHGSLAIILMMASALGVFGATFQSTLTTSERERAQFEVGGDLVIESPFLSRASQVELTSIPGVHALSPVGRDPITLLDGFPGFSAELFTVDPETLHRTAWFRDDFADKSLSEFLRSLRFGEVSSGRERDGHRGTVRSAPNGILLPEDADGIGIWVNEKSLIDARFIQKLIRS